MNYMIFLQKVPNDGKISNECLQNLFNTFTYKNNILIYPHIGGIEETEEIEALSKEFLIFDSPFQEIIELIIKCISRFLFIKAYQNSESIKENYFKQEFKEYHERYCFWNKSYIKLKTLGKGSGGMVELIYHICSESIYALKIPYPDKIKNNEREIENYLNLRHPNIVQYYGYFESDQGKYLILEYVEGKTLDKYDLTKLNFIEKNEIICDIICAVKYIHSKNYICRDLSPNNIIITENIKAIIIDFDNVIKSEEFQNENEPMTNYFGKLSTAPEINKTYQSDIFPIGYIMHYILHGEPPEIQTNDENGNKSIIANDNFLYKECLDIDPKKRPKIDELYESFSIYEHIRLKELLDFFNNDCQVYKKISEDCDGYFFYQLGKFFMQKNQIDKAFYCYTMDANCQNATAQAELGILFYEGQYLPKDMNKSICYFTLAANQNNAQAQYYLGILHIEGDEIPQNINKGFYYLELATNQNYPKAQYDLGVYDQ